MTMELKPVAWMYWPSACTDELPFVQPHRANMDPRYWGETPLYTRPDPSADLVEALEEAADLLERYAAFILTVKADDLELHPYQPAVEGAAMRCAALSKAKGVV